MSFMDNMMKYIELQAKMQTMPKESSEYKKTRVEFTKISIKLGFWDLDITNSSIQEYEETLERKSLLCSPSGAWNPIFGYMHMGQFALKH